MDHVLTTLRLVLVTMFICCVCYTAVVWSIANAATPWTAHGSILTDPNGQVIGSAQVAQAFTRPQYLWPRLSAVEYNAAASGGSNLSPANPKLIARLVPVLERYGANGEKPLPADLASASGSGLDPHITLDAALYQARRVAAARGLSEEALIQWLNERAVRPGGILGGARLIHVLETNIALDRGEVR